MQARYQVEHARYVRLRRKLHRAQGVLAERLVEIYKADQPDCCRVVLESDGFNDLLVRADYLSRIGEQDSAIVDRVRELKERVGAASGAAAGAEGRRPRRPCDVIEAKQRELAGDARRRSRAARPTSPRRAGQARHARATSREHRHELEGDMRGAARPPPRR